MFSGGQPTLSATAVILAQDGWAFDRDLHVFDPQIPESDSGVTQVVFETRLSEAFGSSQTLSLTTADSTAIAGRDYVATRGNITFLAGQTVAFIAVDVLGDTDEGMMEPFSLVVASDAPIVDGIRDGAGIATIRDDDTGLPVLSIEAATATEGEALHFDGILSEPPLADITFTYRTVADSSALSDIDYGEVLANATIPAGQAMVHVVVDIIEDTLIEGAETFSLNMNSAANVFSTADASGAATILNDDANGQNTTGSATDDTFNGANGGDSILAGQGGDELSGGGGGNDVLEGGANADSLDGQAGEDTLNGAARVTLSSATAAMTGCTVARVTIPCWAMAIRIRCSADLVMTSLMVARQPILLSSHPSAIPPSTSVGGVSIPTARSLV